MKRVVLLLLVCLPISPAAAKCKESLFVFSGSFSDKHGSPVGSALVGISWSENSVSAGPAMSLTDSEGRYAIPVSFDRYSGQSILRGDICTGVLTQVSVSAYTDSEKSGDLILHVEGKSQVDVPLLEIMLPIKREPSWPHEVAG